MLYSEGRKGGKKDSGALNVLALFFFLLLLTGCQEEKTYTKRNLTLETFSDMKVDDCALDSLAVIENLKHLCQMDNDGSFASKHTRQYYRGGGGLVWVDYNGVTTCADTLLAILRESLPAMGFQEHVFRLSQIEEDLDRMHGLDFDETHPINNVVSRLDYNLTSAYLRYMTGQRFGFVNPDFVLNRFDARDRDTAGVVLSYRHLFDVGMEHPGDSYVNWTLHQVATDSFAICLRQVETSNPLYAHLKKLLPETTGSQRRRVLINMERCRWRENQLPVKGQKYIIVNVPAYHLWAVGPDSVIDMRVACGAVKTKTPLLSSYITRMEVNPEWVIPMSIIRDDVVRHAGDSGYFARHRYYISERKTGKHLPSTMVTKAMLNSGNYRVAQQGGAGNSLGRIIFRFPNNFSVFLHDTSSPGAFGRDNRGVSHGCVRVQRPFDLAVFLMDDASDDWLLDKLRISMGMKPETERGRDYMDELNPEEPTPTLVHSLPVSPRVPLFITYSTIFRTPDGSLQYYPDVYGYDDVIGKALNTYIQ